MIKKECAQVALYTSIKYLGMQSMMGSQVMAGQITVIKARI